MKTYIGIDWSEKEHCVHIYNENGAKVSQFRVAHNFCQDIFRNLLIENLGVDKTLNELVEAMSSREMQENFEHIVNMWDLNV